MIGLPDISDRLTRHAEQLEEVRLSREQRQDMEKQILERVR
jgi:hypothetical protein